MFITFLPAELLEEEKERFAAEVLFEAEERLVEEVLPEEVFPEDVFVLEGVLLREDEAAGRALLLEEEDALL